MGRPYGKGPHSTKAEKKTPVWSSSCVTPADAFTYYTERWSLTSRINGMITKNKINKNSTTFYNRSKTYQVYWYTDCTCIFSRRRGIVGETTFFSNHQPKKLQVFIENYEDNLHISPLLRGKSNLGGACFVGIGLSIQYHTAIHILAVINTVAQKPAYSVGFKCHSVLLY